MYSFGGAVVAQRESVGNKVTYLPCGDAFVMRFDPTSNTPLLSTFLGGSNDDEGLGVAVDTVGAIYVTGFTFSTNFPTVNPYQGTLNGTATDAFVLKLTQARISLSAATQTVAESVGKAQIGVTLSAAQADATTVNYTLTKAVPQAAATTSAVWAAWSSPQVPQPPALAYRLWTTRWTRTMKRSR